MKSYLVLAGSLLAFFHQGVSPYDERRGAAPGSEGSPK